MLINKLPSLVVRSPLKFNSIFFALNFPICNCLGMEVLEG